MSRSPSGSDESIDRELVMQQARARLFGTEASPVQLGRFRVLDRVGAGGNGVVYAAYDDELDRKVALKLVHTESVEEHRRDRLRREAQALARLAHPNVVAVHEVGEVDGRVFIAMEFVRGATLDVWVEQRERTRREILDVFVQAGRGLAAAHAAGMVHRDFKPTNVMVGDDDRARVMDFGLARLGPEQEAEPAQTQPAGKLETPLTATGAVMGTPAYMAPEQHLGQTADAKADQFSFCVALYEALAGVRPFAGEDRASLSGAVTRGELERSSAWLTVAPRIRRGIERGLDPDPSERWPAMEPLLEQLADRRGMRTRWVLALVGAIGAATVAATFVAVDPDHAAELCARGADALVGEWNAGRRAAVDAAFTASEATAASEIFAEVEGELTSYATDWAHSYRAACAATHERHQQSEGLLDRRLACLRARRQRFSAVVSAFGDADRTVVGNALAAVDGLPRVPLCDDVEALSAAIAPPEDPVAREHVEALRADLALARTEHDLGRPRRGLDIAVPTLAAARELGYAPLTVEVELRHAELLLMAGDFEAADKALRSAYHGAVAAGHDRMALRAATILLFQSAQRARFEDAERWAEHAASWVERSAKGTYFEANYLEHLAELRGKQGRYSESVELRGRGIALRSDELDPRHRTIGISYTNLCSDFQHLDRYDDAVEACRTAREIFEASVGRTNTYYATALTNLGQALEKQARYGEAREAIEQALAVRREVLGPDHFHVGQSHAGLGQLFENTGDYPSARTHLREARRVLRAALGENHPAVAAMSLSLGNVALRMREPDVAEAEYNDALEVTVAAVGPDHPNVGACLGALGNLHYDRGQWTDALANYQRVLEIGKKQPEVRPTHVATAHYDIGRALYRMGRRRAAGHSFQEAMRGWTTALGPDHPELAKAHDWLATLARDRGDAQTAFAHLRPALELREAALGSDSERLGPPLIAWAETLLDNGKPHEALPLAQRAMDVLSAAETDPRLVEEARAVLRRARAAAR